MQEAEAYIIIKDHKEYFPKRVFCPLINPLKFRIGKISKLILDKIKNTV